MTTGERIKEARKKAGMTQAELASKLGISYVGVSQWENNLRNPKYETLIRIANALDTSVDTLLGIEPLPDKDVTFDFGFKKEIAAMSGGAQETDAFDQFLTDLGFTTYIDGTRFSNPLGKEGDIWIIEDTRSGKAYTATTADLNKLLDSILSFTKFQISELLSRLDQINKADIGHYQRKENPADDT